MKIAIIGAGQQGTSQGLAFARLDGVEQVVFYDINPDNKDQVFEKAKEYGVDASKLTFTASQADAVRHADVIGINTPMSSFKDVVARMAPIVKDGVIIYDNGSGKVRAMAEIQEGLGDSSGRVNYFGAHFFVGRAGTSPVFADINMYQGQTATIMGQDGPAKDKLISLFKDIGIKNVRTDLSPEDHDESLGLFSHHNTFAVTALMLAFPQVQINGKPIQIGRFLSSTRVAAHGKDGATFWGPIANDNANAIVEAAKIFSGKLEDVKTALRQNSVTHLKELLGRGFNYASGITPDRQFEGLEGDLHDFETLAIPSESEGEYAASHLAVPIVFATASALTAAEYEERGGQPFTSIGNSSFHDSLRPVRDNFEKAADFIWQNKVNVRAALEKFQRHHSEIKDAIADRRIDDIISCIEESHRLRTQLPDAPKAPRAEFAIG
ncbi:MAG: hypothetical protein DHS20C02_19770 [Micavibrio sp.]|nr:MAG: hypothetical protein DHS20C02_19770 [Micavibrio sp.]